MDNIGDWLYIVFLAIAGIIVRLIGMVYRIPMQNKIGNEAMGIYSSAYYIYNIMLLLSSYSLPLAVSKMVSARVALGQHKNAYRIFQSSLVFSLISGGLACLVTFFGADFFAGVALCRRPPLCCALLLNYSLCCSSA